MQLGDLLQLIAAVEFVQEFGERRECAACFDLVADGLVRLRRPGPLVGIDVFGREAGVFDFLRQPGAVDRVGDIAVGRQRTILPVVQLFFSVAAGSDGERGLFELLLVRLQLVRAKRGGPLLTQEQ